MSFVEDAGVTFLSSSGAMDLFRLFVAVVCFQPNPGYTQIPVWEAN